MPTTTLQSRHKLEGLGTRDHLVSLFLEIKGWKEQLNPWTVILRLWKELGWNPRALAPSCVICPFTLHQHKENIVGLSKVLFFFFSFLASSLQVATKSIESELSGHKASKP